MQFQFLFIRLPLAISFLTNSIGVEAALSTSLTCIAISTIIPTTHPLHPVDP
jgi:hypothetical protein